MGWNILGYALFDRETGDEFITVELTEGCLNDLKDIPMIPYEQKEPFAADEELLTIEAYSKQKDLKFAFQIRSSDDGRFITQKAEQILVLRKFNNESLFMPYIPLAKQNVHTMIDSVPYLKDYAMLAESVAGEFMEEREIVNPVICLPDGKIFELKPREVLKITANYSDTIKQEYEVKALPVGMVFIHQKEHVRGYVPNSDFVQCNIYPDKVFSKQLKLLKDKGYSFRYKVTEYKASKNQKPYEHEAE